MRRKREYQNWRVSIVVCWPLEASVSILWRITVKESMNDEEDGKMRRY